ncbi:MAG: DedA family protein [Candidatus Poribacteria bacterium]
MITHLIDFLASIVIRVIGYIGYGGVFGLMLVESCGILMPSEAIMPFSGFQVALGNMNYWIVTLMGGLGNLVGSMLAYWIGMKGGRPLAEKYGRYVLISKHDLDIADRWFTKYGELTAFFGRLLPIIRTFISFPAGIAKMNFLKFCIYTFIGSLFWSAMLAWIGVKLGENWNLLREKLHNFDMAIAVIIVLGAAWYVWRHIRILRAERKSKS